MSNAVINLKLKKKLEKGDILVCDGNYFTNLSKAEYLALIKKDILELKKADNELNEHCKELDILNERDIFIAKSIYDNYVERGYIDEDEEFDKKFYNYVFNNCAFKEEDLNEDFVKILNKVRA